MIEGEEPSPLENKWLEEDGSCGARMRRGLVAGMVSGILGGVIRGIVEEKVYVLRDMKAYRTQKLELAITLRSQPERLMLSMERTAKWAGLGAVFCCLYTAGTCMFDTEQLGVFGVGLSAGPAGAVTGALSAHVGPSREM